MPPKRTSNTEEPSPKRAKVNTIIQSAKDGKFDKVFDMLDESPAYVNEKPEERMYGTIHQAAFWGDMAAIKKLVENYNADVLLLTKDGKTALEVAKENGHDAVAKYLEAKEANVKGPAKSSAASGSRGSPSILKVIKLNGEALGNVHVQEGSTVADLKKRAAAELKIPWWQQQWTSVKEGGGTILTNDCVMDVAQIPEVTCIAGVKPYFPFDEGKLNLLVVTGQCAREAVYGHPDQHGRLAASGVDPMNDDEVPDAAILEDRLLTIKGDPTPAVEEPGDSYTSAAWSKDVRLDAENAPIILGWRVKRPADWPAPCFGLTTRQHLTTNAGYKEPTAILGLQPEGFDEGDKGSKVVCSQTTFTVGSMIEKRFQGAEYPGLLLEGKVAEIVDGKYVIDFDSESKGKQLREVDVDASSLTGASVKLDCESSPYPSGGDANGDGSKTKVQYDVLVIFDTLKKEVRAVVGYGGPGSQKDKAVVPSEFWPSPDLPLFPFVCVRDPDGNWTMDIEEEDLPITVEPLTSEHMAEEAVSALMGA